MIKSVWEKKMKKKLSLCVSESSEMSQNLTFFVCLVTQLNFFPNRHYSNSTIFLWCFLKKQKQIHKKFSIYIHYISNVISTIQNFIQLLGGTNMIQIDLKKKFQSNVLQKKSLWIIYFLFPPMNREFTLNPFGEEKQDWRIPKRKL